MIRLTHLPSLKESAIFITWIIQLPNAVTFPGKLLNGKGMNGMQKHPRGIFSRGGAFAGV